ncbi:Ankyrin repeat protein [Pandoravirus kuranda]|uniref:Ankyrin repeat protein n=2 Tax=Pandoravirus TaxID=2060084 RepID=A0AA95EGY0_9VIRU|nr:Ankyrin repeat incomplete domain containing protein [Pandoravirus neocaledonia]AVK76141.1 Ankyrin repeat incomplete domain containing protein [Pandoravirus neocaledonia]WBR14673.1 Ankyrin repeat protein [Pandoravirus kuranda]
MTFVRTQSVVYASVAVAALLLSATCSVTAATSITTRTTVDIHAQLVYAALQCDRPAVERILSDAPHAIRGLSVDGSGTALHAVARAPSTDACLDTAAALLRAGVDPLALDGVGRTAVDVARDTDAQQQRPDRPPMGLFLAAAASGERTLNMRNHGPLVDDSAVPPPCAV